VADRLSVITDMWVVEAGLGVVVPDAATAATEVDELLGPIAELPRTVDEGAVRGASVDVESGYGERNHTAAPAPAASIDTATTPVMRGHRP
jgi:hypothetical protein